MKISGLILLAIGSLAFGHPECKDTLERIGNLHGRIQLPSVEVSITICNASTLATHQPINLETYQDYLKLRKNKIMILNIASNTFSQLPNLRTLIASDIDLATVDENAFSGLVNLQYLNLKKNKLETILPNLFDSTPNLIELDLEDNKIRAINEHQFDKLTNLKKLKLARNRLTELPGQWYSGLHSLEYLTLSNNQFRIIRANMFEGLSRLEALRLDNNQITRIEANGFSGLSFVSSLSLQYNGNIQPENLLDELMKLQNLQGLAISPPGLKCGILEKIQDYFNERNIEMVQIPAERRCWE